MFKNNYFRPLKDLFPFFETIKENEFFLTIKTCDNKLFSCDKKFIKKYKNDLFIFKDYFPES